MAKNIIIILIFSISYDINMYHYIHQWEWKYFVNVCYCVLTPNAKRIRASHHIDYLQDVFHVTLNDSNFCFSCCDENVSISRIRQSPLLEQTYLHWLKKVSLLRRTKKLLLRELKCLTASS